eukprot:COSAG06_NODE_4105_length_4571_cov_3.031977_4_plen_90_part_00
MTTFTTVVLHAVNDPSGSDKRGSASLLPKSLLYVQISLAILMPGLPFNFAFISGPNTLDSDGGHPSSSSFACTTDFTRLDQILGQVFDS